MYYSKRGRSTNHQLETATVLHSRMQYSYGTSVVNIKF